MPRTPVTISDSWNLTEDGQYRLYLNPQARGGSLSVSLEWQGGAAAPAGSAEVSMDGQPMTGGSWSLGTERLKTIDACPRYLDFDVSGFPADGVMTFTFW